MQVTSSHQALQNFVWAINQGKFDDINVATIEGCQISKMYVALDLDLSYRLLRDPLSYHDGNIREITAQTLHEAFQPFKEAFAAKGLDLHLLIVQP